MPTYEYKCNKCGKLFEKYQSITAEPLTKCINDDCDGAVTRLFSAGAGFLFKGSGFYSTDYRSDSYKKAASSNDSSTSTEKTTKAGSGSGSTPAPTPSPTPAASSAGSTPAAATTKTT